MAARLHVETQGDPWQGRDSIGRRMVFDSLTRIDSSGAVLPALAVRWQSQNGDHRWQFWLRPGVRFHDGSLLTADSVLQSLDAFVYAVSVDVGSIAWRFGGLHDGVA